MIHYSCDRCRKTIDAQETRFIVQLEVHAAMDPLELDEEEDDRDYLEEIQEILERLDEGDDIEPLRRYGSGHHTYDLCPDCYRKFIQNPVGSDSHAHIGFSPN
jgi:hypothetical protein